MRPHPRRARGGPVRLFEAARKRVLPLQEGADGVLGLCPGCRVEVFRFFGGVPRRLVPDNLKTGVDKPDLHDPQINKSYAELASDYDTLVDESPLVAWSP
ncbi:hypothetical protein ABZT48_09670 [Streptomyces avermitilis]|uniref:hypothetical protein n=1 Tax=Streptomyces avermitilis TaxID=33903 RepID=UPI0033B6B0EE